MTFLFDPGYPPSIVDAIRLILHVGKNKINVVSYTEDVQEDAPEKSVIFLIDDAKKGINEQTRLYVESSYRVFAYKLPRGKKRDRLDMGLTMMQLLPKILREAKEKTGPFLYLIRHNATRLSAINIALPRPTQQSPRTTGTQIVTKREKRKTVRPVPDNVIPLFPQ